MLISVLIQRHKEYPLSLKSLAITPSELPEDISCLSVKSSVTSMTLSRNPDGRSLSNSDHSLKYTENELIYFHIYTVLGQKMILFLLIKYQVKSAASSTPLFMGISPRRWTESHPEQLTARWDLSCICASGWQKQEVGNYLSSHIYAMRKH